MIKSKDVFFFLSACFRRTFQIKHDLTKWRKSQPNYVFIRCVDKDKDENGDNDDDDDDDDKDDDDRDVSDGAEDGDAEDEDDDDDDEDDDVDSQYVSP